MSEKKPLGLVAPRKRIDEKLLLFFDPKSKDEAQCWACGPEDSSKEGDLMCYLHSKARDVEFITICLECMMSLLIQANNAYVRGIEARSSGGKVLSLTDPIFKDPDLQEKELSIKNG